MGLMKALFGPYPDENLVQEYVPEAPEIDKYAECPYKVKIPRDIWLKMVYFTRLCPCEIGAHLEAYRRGSKIFVLNIHMPPQKISDASYEPSSKDFAYIAKTNPKLLSRIKGWFHSHVRMQAYWSPTDNETIKNNIQMFDDYCLSIVMNKKQEYKIRLDVKYKETSKVVINNQERVITNEIIRTYDDLPLYLIIEKDIELRKYCREEIRKKCKRETIIGSVFNAIGETANLLVNPNNQIKPPYRK